MIPLCPEKFLYSEDNTEGAIKHPISVAVGDVQSGVFVLTAHGKIYRVRQHYPAQVKELATIKDSPKGLSYSNGIIYVTCLNKLLFMDFKGILRPPASLTRPVLKSIMTRFHLASQNEIENTLGANDMKRKIKQYYESVAGKPQKPKLRTLDIDGIENASAVTIMNTDTGEDILFVASNVGLSEYNVERKYVSPKNEFQ